ncbi:protein-disulfide reductase DsbD family protein [Hoeflea sp. YIM 152468]|uniref:protein-disulfide reductase DsbD domain-containing protein n=1 Tax=Hoeflea sp. YIM 152468 TaxID=3031759 RepID=UPI0023DC4E39|nr:protein-disulfide reductase DsbD domain-containing protein [Hoeflea sp. YIM 152468]MDF1608565.1 protein-disulfide reductase DsbD family protein [Hoeflea sp. YIM 152468]
MIKQTNSPAPSRLAVAIGGFSIAMALSLAPASSLESDWAETEGGRMRLVIDPTPRQDGAIAGFLDIVLEPGWKTYWRDPGSAGIPPVLDFSQSHGIAFEEMAYPPPVRVDDGYAIWAGYTAPVRFPLTFRRTASGEAEIRALAFIGICEKICVPFQGELVVELPEELIGQDAAKPAVDSAFALLPEPPAADFKLGPVAINADTKLLEIEASLPAFRPSGTTPDVFVAGPAGAAFATPVLERDDGANVRWSVQTENLPPLSGDAAMPLDIVVTLGPRAIEQRIDVNLAATK